jgi:hypothetical protein
MVFMADLGSGLHREGTNEDTSAPVRAKGRRKKACCSAEACGLLEVLGKSGSVVIFPIENEGNSGAIADRNETLSCPTCCAIMGVSVEKR